MRRKRKRKLKKQFKILFITVPVVAAVIALIIFAFQLKTVKVSFDLNQFTESEVRAYMNAKKIDNTLIFWLKNKIGKSERMDMFEEYSVKMNSPFKVTITAYEKKLKGYIENNKIYYYFDDTGRILKSSTEKIDNVPKVTGLEYDKLVLYEKIYVKNKDALNILLKVSSAIEEYNYKVKKIKISDKLETTLYIKKVQVQLGKESNLDKKLKKLNDIYDDVIKLSGVLNMKRLSVDGSYTLKRTEKTNKSDKKK
ncbi:MAG: cell division protein FtsQ/DivIB [Eubacterium sp.]